MFGYFNWKTTQKSRFLLCNKRTRILILLFTVQTQRCLKNVIKVTPEHKSLRNSTRGGVSIKLLSWMHDTPPPLSTFLHLNVNHLRHVADWTKKGKLGNIFVNEEFYILFICYFVVFEGNERARDWWNIFFSSFFFLWHIVCCLPPPSVHSPNCFHSGFVSISILTV